MRPDRSCRASFFGSRPGPSLPVGPAWRAWVAAAGLLAAAGCATAGGGGAPPAEAEPPAEEAPTAEEAGREALEGIRARTASLAAAGEPDRAAWVADSAYFRWRDDPELADAALRALWTEAEILVEAGRPAEAESRLSELLEAELPADLRARAADRLAGLRLRLGEHPGVVALYARHPAVSDSAAREDVRAAAGEMSVAELREASRRLEGRGSLRAVVEAELARGLALAGAADSARAAAARALGLQPSPPDRRAAREVEEGRVGPEDRPPLRVGVVLPLSGRLEGVGAALREGVELAAGVVPGGGSAAEAGPAPGGEVELLIRDDGSDPSRVPEAVRELERAGVVAVIASPEEESFRAAVRARSDPSLPVISPAAPAGVEGSRNVYTLRDRELRVRAVGLAAGEWLARETTFEDVGILRPASHLGREYEKALRAGLRRGGGWVAATAEYLPEGTTFEGPARWLAAHSPSAVFAAAEAPRSVLQLAPQLPFFGLREAVVAGPEVWGEPAVLRRLAGSFPEYWLAAVFVDRSDTASAWSRFRERYERAYRRGVPGHGLTAPAYDAYRWVERALGDLPLPRRAAVSRHLKEGTFSGASGTFRPRPERSTVETEARVLMAHGGELTAPDTVALREWRERARSINRAVLEKRRRDAADRVERWSAGNPAGEGGREGPGASDPDPRPGTRPSVP